MEIFHRKTTTTPDLIEGFDVGFKDSFWIDQADRGAVPHLGRIGLGSGPDARPVYEEVVIPGTQYLGSGDAILNSNPDSLRNSASLREIIWRYGWVVAT